MRDAFHSCPKSNSLCFPQRLLPFKSLEARITAFETAHTHTMFYLAQCYGHLGDAAKSAEYCQRTLQRQVVAKEYDVMEWAINCAAMSQYYITQSNFAQALYCLGERVRRKGERFLTNLCSASGLECDGRKGYQGD